MSGKRFWFYLLTFVIGGVVMVALGLATRTIAVPSRAAAAGPLTFAQMVKTAQLEVTGISAADAKKMIESDPNTLVVDVRDPEGVKSTGLISGGINVTLGTLTYKADHAVPENMRDPNFKDFSRPILTVCYSGELGSLGAKLLKDMGYNNVHYIQGGTVAWKEAGYPTNQP